MVATGGRCLVTAHRGRVPQAIQGAPIGFTACHQEEASWAGEGQGQQDPGCPRGDHCRLIDCPRACCRRLEIWWRCSEPSRPKCSSKGEANNRLLVRRECRRRTRPTVVVDLGENRVGADRSRAPINQSPGSARSSARSDLSLVRGIRYLAIA